MMKKIVLFLLLTQVCYAYPIQQPFPPFRIIGNVYYVGTNDLASYLIVTAKGNILINSNLEVGVPKIKNSIEKLGFKYSDTKILLVSHGHIDHAGGSALIKQQTHAKYMVMNADVPLITSGGKSDFQYSSDSEFYFPKTTKSAPADIRSAPIAIDKEIFSFSIIAARIIVITKLNLSIGAT